jgi:hypothetical protein
MQPVIFLFFTWNFYPHGYLQSAANYWLRHVRLSVCRSVCQSVCPPVCLSVRLSASLYVSSSVCLSVRRLPLVEFYEILYMSIFRKSVYKTQVSLKFDRSNEQFTWKLVYIYDSFLRTFLEWEMCETKVVENTKYCTNFMLSNSLPKVVPFMR